MVADIAVSMGSGIMVRHGKCIITGCALGLGAFCPVWQHLVINQLDKKRCNNMPWQ
jgi:hypothetical protein